MLIETKFDKRKFEFIPERDGWIPHQYEETKQYDSFYGFKKDWVVADIGAWLGIWTIWVSPQVKQVYALEPIPSSFKLLCGNVEINEFENVKPMEIALSSINGKEKMDITKYPAASSIVDGIWNRANWIYGEKKAITVKTETWDTWVKRNNINVINLLKMDVEGAELLILSEMNNVLPERIIIAQYHEPAPIVEIHKALHKKDYVLEGFGYYDKNASNKGKPHSAFFRRKDIPFETHQTYKMQEYALPSRELFDRGIPFYWEEMGVKDD